MLYYLHSQEITLSLTVIHNLFLSLLSRCFMLYPVQFHSKRCYILWDHYFDGHCTFQVLYSDNANSSVRVNVYPAPGERLMTANCARITSINNYATNGIVHVVDRMIRPVTKTLAELLAQDNQFSVLISCKLLNLCYLQQQIQPTLPFHKIYCDVKFLFENLKSHKFLFSSLSQQYALKLVYYVLLQCCQRLT